MYLLICFRFKNRKVELNKKIMLASFLMVLVQLPLRKISPPSSPPLPPPYWAGEWGNCRIPFPHDFSYNVRVIFTKKVFMYYVISEGRWCLK